MQHTSNTPQQPSVPDMAAQLASLIADRGLVPGDRFLTTQEAAQHLKVRRDLANRALQVLTQRGQIERSQRIGSRVAEPKPSPRTFERLRIVVQIDYARAQPAPSAAFQVGLHKALPGCEIDIDLVRGGDAAALLEPLVRSALRQPTSTGLVLVRCDYPTQRLAADCGLPAVLHGSPYAGIKLSSVDKDGVQMGRLQAEALIQRGCDRLVVVRRDRTLPGDRVFMDGFREAASEHGFGCGRIDELELAPYAEVVAAELAILFGSEEKLGIVCSSRQLADATWNAATKHGRTIGDDLWLHGNEASESLGAPPFPHIAPVEGDEARGAQLGELLAAQLADPHCAHAHHRVPVELVHPDSAP